MELNKEQREAVYTNNDKILCLAGAGCGKTHCMIERILRLVNDGVSPSAMLVLTFTNAAAFEMQTRYLNRRKDQDNPTFPNFRTFHSFCYSLIASDSIVREAIGYGTVPDIATEAEMKEISKMAAEQSGIKLSEKKLQIASEFIRSTLHKATKRILLNRNLITFDIMCYDVCKLFVEDASCIQKYKAKYEYIFVDEFQDTDPKQWEFVSSFQTSKLFVVADALQAIYAFRGADSSIVKNLADDNNWYKVKLTYNYRSTSQICDFANHNSEHGEESYRVKINSCVEGDPVFCTHYDQLDTLKQILIDCNRFHVNNGGTCAILVRTNSEVQQIANLMKSLNIPITLKDSEANQTAAIIRSLKDPEYAITWLASKLRAGTYLKYIHRIYEHKLTFDEFVTDFVRSWEADYLVDTVELLCNYKQELMSIKSQYDMHKFVEHIGPKRLPSDVEIHRRSELLDKLLEMYAQDDATDIALADIYVGTIHSVKGLEYDSVMLLNVGGKSFRLTNEENLNLYYVGITRAKRHLYIWTGDLYEYEQEQLSFENDG